ncbi:hypothetical protein M409DRAFT_24835 [Zasmidium cellare ATCC 36951]|uniref:AB hydrolase-1 domain-containing protein n=1 Tax=Zasmidium cellare ATCC 36951 TaxID=1080233 RepID=A0A6A6CE13_ZASCE|nr:uncharacterized protein M409DRAFT_24835 [Zasmidium cellare ATCC 36951]KAF2164933.1 hypothetical protein M409DRAFT_24835 [Zasmidium cellare ATCC 36951]
MSGSLKSMTFDGVKISYKTYSLDDRKTETPVLCFVHGWCCSSALWQGQEPLFKKHASIVIDIPGHGLSDKPQGREAVYGAEFFGRSINAVLEAEDANKVVLVGHSVGGYWCTMVLRLFGEDKVKGIFFCNSFFTAPTHSLTSTQRKAWADSIKDDEQFSSFVDSLFSDKYSRAIREQVSTTMVHETPLHVRTGCIQTNYLSHHWGVDEVYSETPMLHLRQKGSPDWDERAKFHFPTLTTETWEGVGHFIFMEEVDKFNDRVQVFLEHHSLVPR